MRTFWPGITRGLPSLVVVLVLAACGGSFEGGCFWTGDCPSAPPPSPPPPDATPAAGWQRINIAPTSIGGSYSSLALDAFGYAHISYRTSTGVAYATNSPAGTWSSQTVDSTAGTYGGTSIAVDGAGHVHLSYYDPANNRLMYATNASGTWTLAPVATSGGHSNSIAVDAAGIVSIAFNAYWNTMSAYILNFVTSSGSGWNDPVIVAASKYPFESISLAQDPSGLPRAAYADQNGTIGFVSQSAAYVWTNEVFGVSAQRGAALALDTSGIPHVAYMDWGDLMHATNVSGTWVLSVIDHLDWVGGQDVSIAVGPGNKLHVSYQDNNWDLNYSTNTSGGWLSYVIDAAGSIGAYSSLRVDTAGKIHISYDDTTNHALKYARSP